MIVAAEPLPQRADPAPAAGLDAPRVVVADDHPLFRQGIVRALEAVGVSVVAEVGDGAAALAAIERHRPDVALIDVSMPPPDGIDVVRAVTRLGLPVPVVLLSAFIDDSLVTAGLEAGAAAYISKTADRERILRTVLAVGGDRDASFEDLVAASLDALPDEFLRAIEHVAVVVADDGAANGLYGLYHGAGAARAEVPARIVVFRDTLVRDFGDDPVRLAAEVRRTVWHEIAHHLGYGERGVAGLGL